MLPVKNSLLNRVFFLSKSSPKAGPAILPAKAIAFQKALNTGQVQILEVTPIPSSREKVSLTSKVKINEGLYLFTYQGDLSDSNSCHFELSLVDSSQAIQETIYYKNEGGRSGPLITTQIIGTDSSGNKFEETIGNNPAPLFEVLKEIKKRAMKFYKSERNKLLS